MSMNEKYPLALSKGTILAGQYTIEKVLGQGGFGITYEAIDYKTNQKVAVKEFFPDTLAYREAATVISYPGERSESYEYGKESFLQEAKTLAEFIGNENIVRIHSYFEENGTAYFVMDYIEGTSFDDYIKEKGGKVSVEEAKKILIPMMDALGAVHSKGIVHRDVTPDNIYVTNDSTVKLLDFGAARYSLGDKSRSLDVILKHGFAPKEQYTRRGKQGPFTDIYSLGATFYFAITGRRPPDSVDRLDEDDLIPPSNLGVDITDYQERAILQALSVQPAERFQTMDVFKKVLLNENNATNQIFFTAPEAVPVSEPAVAPAVQQVSSPVQPEPFAVQNTEQSIQPAGKSGKPQNKKLIIGIAGALAVVFIMGRGFSGGSESRDANTVNADTSGSGSIGEVSNPQSLDEYDYSDDAMPVSGVPETEPSDTAPETPTEAAVYSDSESYIVGNTAANIKNLGLITVYGENNSFTIDDDAHSLMSNGKYLYENWEGIFSCLSYYNGTLYFLYNSTAYTQDIKQGTDATIIPELEPFGGNIQRLYVTVDYYFIYDDGALYRIVRSSGDIEDWLEISSSDHFTFDDDGWLYYIGEDPNGVSLVNRVAADDFSFYSEYSLTATSGQYTDLVVDGDYVYVLQKDGSVTYINRFPSDFVFVGGEIERDISAVVNADGQSNGNYACHLNVMDNHIFFDVYEASGDSYSLYHLVLNSTGYKSESISRDEEGDACYPCVSEFKGSCTVFYMKYGEDDGKRTLRLHEL